MIFEVEHLEAAHEHCFGNKPEVRASVQACCIACARSFPAVFAKEAALQSDRSKATILCPVCMFDTVIGDASGYPVTENDFIFALNKKYQDEPLGSDVSWKELLDAQD